MTNNKLSLKFNLEKFTDFVDKLQDLTKINDILKIKISKDLMLLYSLVKGESAITAFKCYTLNTNDVFLNFNEDETFDYIMVDAKKTVKFLKFFNPALPIKLDLTFKPSQETDAMHIRAGHFSNEKLKITCIGGEEMKIPDINIDKLEARLNIKKSKWGFNINKEEFIDIKKMAAIVTNPDEKSKDRVININVTNGRVTINEASSWEHEVDKIDAPNANLPINKKYLSNINLDNDDEVVSFYVFETFILVKDDTYSLFFAFETSFEDEDE